MPGKILVVDDDPDILDAVTMILESQGYNVVTARDGVEGLATLKAENPDMMILDLMMPKMDGFAVCKELQDPRWSKYRAIPSTEPNEKSKCWMMQLNKKSPAMTP